MLYYGYRAERTGDDAGFTANAMFFNELHAAFASNQRIGRTNAYAGGILTMTAEYCALKLTLFNHLNTR
ncbi:hypothetical protein AwEntero_26970 [Enterobacterales bacterium]|nr:hypothetical protein AwEntero_26970 [Enterobacterales bacterium]